MGLPEKASEFPEPRVLEHSWDWRRWRVARAKAAPAVVEDIDGRWHRVWRVHVLYRRRCWFDRYIWAMRWFGEALRRDFQREQ